MNMFAKEYTADDVTEAPQEDLAPEGFYSVILRSVDVSTTKATQGRVDLTFSPLKEAGKAKTVYPGIEFGHMVLVDRWEDEDKFCASKAEKLAAKKGIDIFEIPSVMVGAELLKAKANAQRGMFNAMRALLDTEVFQEVPVFDKGAKAFFDAEGKSYTKAQKDAIYESNLILGCNKLLEVATEQLDIIGYVCYAKVEHNEFNGRKKAQIKSLFGSLPKDATVVPPAEWL